MSSYAGIRAALLELRAEHGRIADAIAVLEKIVGLDTEEGRAAAVKTRRGGGRKPVAKAASTRSAGAVTEKPVHNLACAKCKTKYVSVRANGACPSCHPRNLTAKEHYAAK